GRACARPGPANAWCAQRDFETPLSHGTAQGRTRRHASDDKGRNPSDVRAGAGTDGRARRASTCGPSGVSWQVPNTLAVEAKKTANTDIPDFRARAVVRSA